MQLLLIDLDSTLLDLTDFKKNLFEKLNKTYKIPVTRGEEIYNQVKSKLHWPHLFAKQIESEFSVPIQDFMNLFHENLQSISIIHKSLEFLKTFEGEKYLFTLGDKDFQTQKIKQFDLERFFNGILITSIPKIEYLSNIIENDTVTINAIAYTEVTLVDDDQEFLTEVRRDYPWINVVSVTDIV